LKFKDSHLKIVGIEKCKDLYVSLPRVFFPACGRNFTPTPLCSCWLTITTQHSSSTPPRHNMSTRSVTQVIERFACITMHRRDLHFLLTVRDIQICTHGSAWVCLRCGENHSRTFHFQAFASHAATENARERLFLYISSPELTEVHSRVYRLTPLHLEWYLRSHANLSVQNVTCWEIQVRYQ